MLAIFVLLTFFFSLYRWKNRQFFRIKSTITSISEGLLTVKAIVDIIFGTHKSSYKPTVYLTRSSEVSPRRMHIGLNFTVVVDNPEQVQKILNSKSSINKSSIYKNFPFDSCKYRLAEKEVKLWIFFLSPCNG